MKKHKQSLYIIVLVVQILLLLALLPGCFSKKKQVIDTNWWIFNQYRESQSFSLPAGVYTVHVEPQFEAGDWVEIGLKGSGNYFRSLLGNPVKVNAGQGAIDFMYYVLPGATHVALYYDMLPQVEVSFSELTIERVNLGSRILLCVVFLVLAIFDLAVLLQRRIWEGKVSKEAYRSVFGLFACILLETFPLWTDYLICGENTLAYLINTEVILQNGIKGSARMVLGDLAFTVPVLFRTIGFDVTICYKTLCAVIIAFSLLMVYGMVNRIFHSHYAGLAGALVLGCMPWNITLIYQRGDLSAFLFTGFFALLLTGGWILWKGTKKERTYGAGLSAIALFLMALSYRFLARDLTPALILMVVAALSLVGALIVSWLFTEANKKWPAKMVIIVTLGMLVCLLPAIYRLNMIAFEAEPHYLYTAESFMNADASQGE